jgi:chemotaxis protein MotB
MPPMSNTKAIATAVLTSSLILAGCGTPRELGYRELQVMEQKDHILALKQQLVEKPQPKDDKAYLEQFGKYGAEAEWIDGELVISMPSDILFKPGSNSLNDSDKANLKQIVGLINQKYATNYLRVSGHTDSDPVVIHKDKWDNNWDLSGGRSRAVLEYLIDDCGISPKRIYFAGYGENRPKASNADKDGKRRNRRVEIVVIPRQMQ